MDPARRQLADSVHGARRLAAFTGEVLELLGPLVDDTVGLRVFHVDEVAEIVLPDHGRTLRWGFVALTSHGLALGWRSGWRRRRIGRRWIRLDDVTEYLWHEHGLRLVTDTGVIELAWRPDSVERADTEAAFWLHAPLG